MSRVFKTLARFALVCSMLGSSAPASTLLSNLDGNLDGWLYIEHAVDGVSYFGEGFVLPSTTPDLLVESVQVRLKLGKLAPLPVFKIYSSKAPEIYTIWSPDRPIGTLVTATEATIGTSQVFTYTPESPIQLSAGKIYWLIATDPSYSALWAYTYGQEVSPLGVSAYYSINGSGFTPEAITWVYGRQSWLKGAIQQYAIDVVPVRTPTPTPTPERPTIVIGSKRVLSTRQSKLKIQGSTQGATTSVTYSISGKRGVAAGDTHWSFNAPLKIGKNRITVTAQGPGGTSAPSKLTVTRWKKR